MTKFLITLALTFICSNFCMAGEIEEAQLPTTSVQVFQSDAGFGLKDGIGQVIVEPNFKKLIQVGEKAWICQKNSKFGLINEKGEFLVSPRYRFADRVFGRYAKLGNNRDFGLYDQTGKAVILPEYMSIEPLGARMFLVSNNYKYGVINTDGVQLLPSVFDDIYTPRRGVLMAKYKGKWYESELFNANEIILSFELDEPVNKKANVVAASGFGAVWVANSVLKPFSIISPSYEKTIDDLVYSQGADAVNVLINFSWLPKFPATYAQNYYNYFKAPTAGPLGGQVENLKNKIR
jgi:hypothetical protein